MNISYNWLREIYPVAAEPERLAELLTSVGLAVEGIHATSNDFVLDIDLTSNRPDCLSHLGVARELAVIERGAIKYSAARAEIPQAQIAGETAEFTSVVIEDPDLCPRYAARVVRGVKIGPSPKWLVERLAAVGQRSVNNVADITNVVMLELGQPLHAFDLDQLAQQRIVVRRARVGEKLTTLDGVERELDPEMLMICDAAGPVAVGGVMGGEASGISDSTVNVLIESAYFTPASVRRTARVLGLNTEASYRFERGTDWAGVRWAQDRCVTLICGLADGTATADAIDVFPREPAPVDVSLRPERVAALTGLTVDEDEMRRILIALGFSQRLDLVYDGTGRMNFVVPTWRGDVSIEEDLVEEIARHVGYDKMRDELPPSFGAGELQPAEPQKRALRNTLATFGFDEAISYSFINAAHDHRFDLIPEFARRGGDDPNALVELRDSIIEGAVRMRPTLLPGMLEAVRHNFNRGTRDVRLFELGRIFQASAEPGELPVEREALSLIATGGWIEEGRAGAVRELDFYDLKGAVEAAADALQLPALGFAEIRARHLRPGQSAAIMDADGNAVGSIGRLNEALSGEFKFRQPVYVAELDLTHLLHLPAVPVRYMPLGRYPSVVRDISVLVSRRITVAELIASLNTDPAAEWRGAVLVDTYEGKGVSEGQRSVTLRLSYQSADRTLRDEEVEQLHATLVDRLSNEFGAQLRA
jgi:phenylalanyl-tRNA synthetase beta chain